MIEKWFEWCESVKATVLSGIALAASLILSLLKLNIPLFLDPAWIAVIISGLPIIYNAIRKLIKNQGISKISSALLISVAMIASIIIGDLFAAGEVAFIMAIGEILEHKTVHRAKKGLKKLIDLAPTMGRLIVDGGEKNIPAEEIKVGDIIRILPGETIPVDGDIISGETSIDQSIITGESIPVDKSIGDEVFCGTINRFGSIDITAKKVGEDSSLQKLIRMVKDAENKKAPMQRTADKWASWLVPVALLLAVIGGIIKQDIVVAVTILVVFCPCALVLATPTAIMAAIGQATKHGVIIKSGEALEKMGKVDTVAFDKTGTLTYGKLCVSDVIGFNETDENELLLLTASAESKSEHPLAKAILAKAKEENIQLASSEKFEMEAGKGISAVVNGNSILCGNEKFIAEKEFEITDRDIIENLKCQGKALVITVIDNIVSGVIALSDVLKDDSQITVKRLFDMKTEPVLLTGDNQKAAEYFGSKAGITKIYSNLLPEEKVKAVNNLKSQGKTVAMVGDGVNDAPALKTADVGIAMGDMGSDIAVEAADIALVGDNIEKIPYLKKLSTATLRTIKFSIFLSLFINFLAIILSFLELLTPTTGALVHNAGSVFVVMIAALLYERKFD